MDLALVCAYAIVATLPEEALYVNAAYLAPPMETVALQPYADDCPRGRRIPAQCACPYYARDDP